MSFFFNDTATTEIYTLSLHNALPISIAAAARWARSPRPVAVVAWTPWPAARSSGTTLRHPQAPPQAPWTRTNVAIAHLPRSEEHTSELQSRQYLVCRLLLEKKKHTTP